MSPERLQAALQQTILDKYTEIKVSHFKPIPHFHVWLKVDDQWFCVSPLPFEYKDDAEHTRAMLANALTNLILRIQDDISKLE